MIHGQDQTEGRETAGEGEEPMDLDDDTGGAPQLLAYANQEYREMVMGAQGHIRAAIDETQLRLDTIQMSIEVTRNIQRRRERQEEFNELSAQVRFRLYEARHYFRDAVQVAAGGALDAHIASVREYRDRLYDQIAVDMELLRNFQRAVSGPSAKKRRRAEPVEAESSDINTDEARAALQDLANTGGEPVQIDFPPQLRPGRPEAQAAAGGGEEPPEDGDDDEGDTEEASPFLTSVNPEYLHRLRQYHTRLIELRVDTRAVLSLAQTMIAAIPARNGAARDARQEQFNRLHTRIRRTFETAERWYRSAMALTVEQAERRYDIIGNLGRVSQQHLDRIEARLSDIEDLEIAAWEDAQ